MGQKPIHFSVGEICGYAFTVKLYIIMLLCCVTVNVYSQSCTVSIAGIFRGYKLSRNDN